VPINPDFRSLRSRLALPVGLLVGTYVLGVFGYHWLWRGIGGTWMDSLFMTFITVATIGFGEVKPLNDAARLFTMLIAATGIGSVGYILSVGLDYLTSDSTRLGRRMHRMQERIDKLKEHFVVAGFGRVGSEAALELHQAGVDVVVVETTAGARLAEEAGLLVLEGDASEDTVLERAGIRRAKGLVVATGSDATNLYIILSARLLSPHLLIASRAVDESSIPKLMRAGANRAVNPYVIGGRRLAHLMVSSQVVDFFETTFERGKQTLKVAGIKSSESSARILGTVVPTGSEITVLAILRGEEVVVTPDPSFLLSPDDRLLVLGSDAQIAALERTMSQGSAARDRSASPGPSVAGSSPG
jgi:voltage-gated potassium channel